MPLSWTVVEYHSQSHWADVPKINLEELVKDQLELRYHFTVVIRSYFMFFYDFCKFDCTQHVDWGILLHTISYHFSEM